MPKWWYSAEAAQRQRLLRYRTVLQSQQNVQNDPLRDQGIGEVPVEGRCPKADPPPKAERSARAFIGSEKVDDVPLVVVVGVPNAPVPVVPVVPEPNALPVPWFWLLPNPNPALGVFGLELNIVASSQQHSVASVVQRTTRERLKDDLYQMGDRRGAMMGR